MSTAKINLRLQRTVTLVAVILFFTKLAAWWITGSVSILTDALESTVNVVAGFISLYSLYVAAKPRDEDHPYGHGKAEFISAAVEGSMIAIAGLIIIYESIKGFMSLPPTVLILFPYWKNKPKPGYRISYLYDIHVC